MKIYEITGYYPTGGATPIDVIDKVNQKIQPMAQKAKAVLQKDKVLNPQSKQKVANVISNAEQKPASNPQETPLWGRILFFTTALMMIVNKISAAAATAISDKDGDGDIDWDDYNELMPNQIDRLQKIHSDLENFVKTPEFQKLDQKSKNEILDFAEEITDAVNNNLLFHTMDEPDTKERDSFADNSEQLNKELLKQRIWKNEASKPYKGNEHKVKFAHEKYGNKIDYIKLSDDPLAVYKMYDTEGNYRVYLDSKGKPTVGIGHLIDNTSPVKHLKVGDTISPAQAEELFNHDVEQKIKDVEKAIQKHPNLQYVDFEALVDVQFQMGNKVWELFDNTMKLIDAGKFLDASKEALVSDWAKQTPKRAKAFSDALIDAYKLSPNLQR